MNRNAESHFSELPHTEVNRSIFDRSHKHMTTGNIGDLIPFSCTEILPGDSVKITTSKVIRLQTLLTPIMDNIVADFFWFYVPMRLVWNHTKEFFGENTQSAWIPQTEYVIPKIYPPVGGWSVGSLADYFGIPPLKDMTTGQSVQYPAYMPSALPFRGYCLICNEWFRDQNLSSPINFSTGDANQVGSNGDNYITDLALGGKPFKVAKYHDYFTSVLPAPSKGPSLTLFPSTPSQGIGQLGASYTHFAPVVSRDAQVPNFSNQFGVRGYSNNNGLRFINNTNLADNGIVNIQTQVTGSNEFLKFANLWADLSQANITINELRQAFQLQKFFEKSARAGSRYREILKEHFGITSSDARMQIPEYLGGHRFPLSIHQVANQSQGESDFLGDLGAMSNTSDVHEDFVKSFEEHGYVFGLCCVRYDHSYPQGLEKFWMRYYRNDFYFPVFANLGEMLVYKSEIDWDINAIATPNYGFGYQEAWADYRYKPSRVSGEMRPGVPNSLATWHLADYYENIPALSDSWIREDKSNVDRVLSVTSSVSNQVFCDFYVKNIATRPMPMYSIPGLIDHH